jgi:hypothetical protein
MKKWYFLVITVALIISVAANVYLLRRKSLPIVSDGSGISDTVNWYSSARVSFAGVALSLENKKSNLRDGYQFFAGEVKNSVRPPYEPRCEVTNTLVHNENVTIDRPFEAQERECKILKFDGENQAAIVESHGIVFSVKGRNVTWQDKGDNGPLVSVFDRVFENHKFE